MGELVTTAKNYLTKIKLGKLKGTSMWLILTIVYLVVFIILLYLVSWIYISYTTKKPILNDLIVLLNAILSPQAIAGISFLALALVDTDGDGVSDYFKKELDEPLKPQNPMGIGNRPFSS